MPISRIGEFVPFGNPDLGLHQVAHGHQFGHGMFDLNARIGFDEIEFAVLVHQEFDGAGIDVADMVGDLQRIVTNLLAFLLTESRGRVRFR